MDLWYFNTQVLPATDCLRSCASVAWRAVLCCAVLQAYCREFGCNWWMFLEDELLLVMQDDAVLEQADAVHWLVQEAGLEELAGIDAGKCYFVSSLHLNRLFGWGDGGSR